MTTALSQSPPIRFERLVCLVVLFSAVAATESHRVRADWKPAEGPLATRWANDVSPTNALPEYPRPQLVRPAWSNLNGLWEYAIRPKGESQPDEFDGEILVPFAIESSLSGVMKTVGPENELWYRRSAMLPKLGEGDRLLLHFEAVDWEATVWVNGKEIGSHRGGYDGFSLDITGAFARSADVAEIVVRVWDPTDAGYQPRGKQVGNPRGIWYTSVTGIWQTVWLEPVPAASIDGLSFYPDLDRGELRVAASGRGTTAEHSLALVARAGNRVVGTATGGVGDVIRLAVADVRAWSPDDPFLYDLTATLRRGDEVVDVVQSYFALRSIEMAKDADGFNRFFLNGEPIFHFGPLDQGWWPDGLYTAPTDAALRYDVEVTHRMGFNMARKHVKIEPRRWYYHCDQLGLMVWQDLPNGDRHIRPDEPDIERSPESAANFARELRAMIDRLQAHPSIVVWVPFNEGWGQFDTHGVLGWVEDYDPTRLVDGPSGWTDRGTGHIHDIHRYPGPAMPEPESNRIAALGEFGGLGLPLEGHLWWNKRNWGYRTYRTKAELLANYRRLLRKLHPMVGRGLAAAIYTQTSDVEGEVNGLLTYDRDEVKLGVEILAKLNRALYGPPPIIHRTPILATSETDPAEWRYTLEEPRDGWETGEFDDSAWTAGPGGFGQADTPGARVRTEWTSERIWLRRKFSVREIPSQPLFLRIHHDEDADVYLNGRHLASLTGYTTEYEDVPIGVDVRSVLRAGENTLAVRCRQTGGGQYIDVGLVAIVEESAER